VALGSQRCPPAHPEAQRRKVFGMHPSERKEERKKERKKEMLLYLQNS